MVEHDLAKVGVEGSSPFARSNLSKSALSTPCGENATNLALGSTNQCRNSIKLNAKRFVACCYGMNDVDALAM